MITIENFLSPEGCDDIKGKLAKLSFESGSKTAGAMAANVKNNLQIEPHTGKKIIEDLKKFILSDSRIRETVFPKDIGKLLINRYDVGMEYGIHSDAPFMDGLRTDVSFTIFLEHPSAYEGGELVLHYPHGTVSAKPQRGSIVLYSTGVMHRVEKVTKGSRLACVGWIESFVRDEAEREILRELKYLQLQYVRRHGHDFLADLFLKNIGNIERRWSN